MHTDKDTRIALLGCGGISQRHLNNLKLLPGVRLVGACDLDQGKAQHAAQHAGARAYTDWQAMLDEETPDAMLVCTPAKARGRELFAAVERGIGLFIEKPAAPDPMFARELLSAAQTRNAVVAVGYMWRYLQAIAKARTLIGSREVGVVRGTAMHHPAPGAWFWDKERSGGQIYDQVTHLLNAAQMFVGDAESVFACGTIGRLNRADYVKTEDVSVISVKYENGSVGGFVNCWASKTVQFTLELHGTDFSLVVDLGKNRLDGIFEGVGISFQGTNDPYLDELAAFVDAVRHSDPSRLSNPFSCGRETLALTLAANRSLESGQFHTVEKF